MKVTLINVGPSENTKDSPTLSPELVAAVGARYSRSNDGIEHLIEKAQEVTSDANQRIFDFVSYGHRSIADMAPVVLVIDELSMLAAYEIFNYSQKANGQETSTRYVKFDSSGVVQPYVWGLDEKLSKEYMEFVETSFNNYHFALDFWTKMLEKRPGLLHISNELRQSADPKDKLKVDRLVRNFAFDRARYFLPASCKTGMFINQSAKDFSDLIRHLRSHYNPEFRNLGFEMGIAASASVPNLLRHVDPTADVIANNMQEFERLVYDGKREVAYNGTKYYPYGFQSAFFNCMKSPSTYGLSMEEDIKLQNHRYSPVGSLIRRTAVRFGWSNVSFAEIRDFNRHRTGTRYCPRVPRGFYAAQDQIPHDFVDERAEYYHRLNQMDALGRRALEILAGGNYQYEAFISLGTEFYFEHTTTLDKLIYEIQLRTGVGSHFKYAELLRGTLEKVHNQFPELKNYVVAGTAEPE